MHSRICLIFPFKLSFFSIVNIIPSVTDFAKQVKNEEDTIQVLVKMGVIKAVEDEVCIEVDCGGRMGLKNRKTMLRKLKCNRCRAYESHFTNTFFDGTKKEIHTILYLAIMWLNRLSIGQVLAFTKNMSNKSITNYYSQFNQLVANMIDEIEIVLDGEDVEVEIDKSKFAKRKYHQGHHVGTKDWVFGGTEKLSPAGELKKRYFAVIVCYKPWYWRDLHPS